VLTVVEDEEQLSVGQCRRHLLGSGLAREPESEMEGHGLLHAVRAADCRQRDDDDVGRRPVRCDVQRETGLAHAAGTRERDDAVRGEESQHLLAVVLASDHGSVRLEDPRRGRADDAPGGDLLL
jgi:hypothetical protein